MFERKQTNLDEHQRRARLQLETEIKKRFHCFLHYSFEQQFGSLSHLKRQTKGKSDERKEVLVGRKFCTLFYPMSRFLPQVPEDKTNLNEAT